MAALEEQEKIALSLKELIAEQNRLLAAQLQIDNDRLKTSKDDLATQQDISNIIKSQTQALTFQKAEKSAILRSTNSIAKIQEELTVLDRKELGSKKLTLKLSNDISKVNKDIRLLEITKNKLLGDQQGLTKRQVENNVILAGSIDEQVEKALKLKSTLEDTANTTDKLGSNFGSQTFGFLDDLSKAIPGLARFTKPLSTAADASRDMASGIENAAMSGGKGLTKERIKQLGLEKELNGLSGRAASQRLKGMSSQKKGMLALKAGFKTLGPAIASAFGPVALIAMLVKAFIQSDKAAGDMAKSMNMTYKESLATRRELKKSADLSFSNKVTTQGMQDSLVAMSEALGTNTMLSKEMLVQFTEMREYAGFTNKELQGIAAISLTTGKTMNEVTGEFMAQAQISATQNGVLLNEKELLKDIGNVSAATTLSLGKNPALIADAVATAKSLGMELSKVDGIASSLLDFESSITNELEAELLLGKDINLEKARLFALENDLAGVAREISKQAGSTAEFTAMNRLQQEALAKSVGMSREDLAQTLFIQEQLKGATGEEAQEREKLLNNRIAEVGLEQAQRELAEEGIEGLREQDSQASRLSATLTKVQELFVAIAEPILVLTDLLLPVVEFIGSMVSGIMAFSTMVGESIAYVGNLAEGLSPLSGILKGIASVAILLAGYLAYGALAWIPVVGPILGLAASAAVITAGFSALSSKPKQAGDMYSANGKTLVSPAEGGLFELSNNDEFAAAPGLGAMIANNNNNNNSNPPTQTVVQQDNSEAKRTNALLEALINKPAPKVQMDSIEVGTVAGMSAFSIQ